ATSSRVDATATRRGREPGSAARVEAVAFDNCGVGITGVEPFPPDAGALANGSTLSVAAPEVPADGPVELPVDVALEVKGCDALDELELALSLSPGCVAAVDEFPLA